jgi:hypothetical protein
VRFPDGESASTLLLRLLGEAKDAFPEALGPVALPRDREDLERRLSTLVLEVEQRRAASPDGVALARHLAQGAFRSLRFVDESGREAPLAELASGPPFELTDAAASRSAPGWRPAAPFDGETVQGAALARVIDALQARRHLDDAMAATLRRALARLDRHGRLDLSGEHFALLGAGAEIAPTRHLLDAGATVLWCDRVPPPEALAAGPGRLVHAAGASDLLAVPDRVLRTVARFAEREGPVHLGSFAYGPGKGREWRLAAAMNAIARRLPASALRSVGLYVSPTSPAPLALDEGRARAERLERASVWQRSATALGALRMNRAPAHGPSVADVVVPIQGVSYQAAQWLEKRLAMAALAADRPELRVSANVAPITQTRSLEHPVFKVAFRGAPAFGVCAYPPAFTRTLSGLAYVEDVTGSASSTFAEKHLDGGVFALPYALESAIRLAAVRGLFGKARTSQTRSP